MRVALVCPYDLRIPGGVQSHVVALASALRLLGDDVVVVAPGTHTGPGVAGDGAATVAALAPRPDVAVGGSVSVPFNGSRAPVAVSPLAVRRTLAALRGTAPDVVHVHEPLVPVVSLAATVRPAAPTVATFHTWSDSDRIYRRTGRLVRRAVGRLAVRLAVSEAAKRYHAAALDLPEASFRLVPNGVDVARFAAARPLPELAAPDIPTMLFVGRLEPRKGLEQLIAAYALLRSQRRALRLLVLGDGPERDRCQALLPARLRPDVIFLGRVDEADKPAVFASADVFAAPALGGESFGIVLLEAMAAGLPVVASAIDGYRGVMADGVNGRLVRPDDPRELARALGALIDNPSLRAAMAKQARETAAAHDWPVVARRIRSAYRDALGQPPTVVHR